LIALFESLPPDVDLRHALAAEAQARGDALAMRRAYVRSDLAAFTWRVRERTRIDRENRELEDATVVRDEVVVAAMRDRARYHVDLAAVAAVEMARVAVEEELAHVAVAEATETAAQRAH
jgi:hypothetical protein